MKPSSAFLLLILAQAAHSIEEFVTRLYDVLAPARIISDAISTDRATGFLIANAALVTLGLLCWVFPVCQRWPSARLVAWAWVMVELANGFGHALFALGTGGYFPGVATAPLLLFAAAATAVSLRRHPA